MRRIHLFELEDQAWFPALIRDAGTAYLHFATTISGQARLLAPKLREALEASGQRRVIDLCSGGAGPLPEVLQALADEGFDASALMTDRYPNFSAFEHVSAESEGRIDFSKEPVDAMDVPPRLTGLRTLYSALHHFRPAAARGIFQSAVDTGQPIASFEIVSRHPAMIMGILFAPIAVLLSVPFLRPFRWSWLPLTYLIPVIPLFVLWDGFVSCLRVYSTDELEELIASLDGGDRFVWEVGNIPMSPVPVPAIYCVGVPRAQRG